MKKIIFLLLLSFNSGIVFSQSPPDMFHVYPSLSSGFFQQRLKYQDKELTVLYYGAFLSDTSTGQLIDSLIFYPPINNYFIGAGIFSDGKLGIVSYNSLIVFDGDSLKRFQYASGGTNSFLFDSSGTFYAAPNWMQNQIVIFSDTGFQTISFPNISSTNGIDRIIRGPYNDLRVITQTDSLFRFENDSMIYISQVVNSNTVYDNLGNLWFTTPYSLAKQNSSGQVTNYDPGSSLPWSNNQYFTFCINDDASQIWLTHSNTDTIYRFHSGNWTVIPNPFPGMYLLMKWYSDSTVFISRDSYSVLVIKGDSLLLDSTQIPISTSSIIDLERLNTGNVSYEAATTSQIAGELGLNSISMNIPMGSIRCIASQNENYQSSGNNFYIGTNNGLFEYLGWDYTTVLHFTTANSGLPTDTIRCLKGDNYGVWIGTDSGLIYYSNGTFQIYDTSNSPLPSNKIKWIEVVRLSEWPTDSCYVLMGIDSGCAVLHKGQWQLFTSQLFPNLHPDIRHAYMSKYGSTQDVYTFWFATMGGGIAKYDTANGMSVLSLSNGNFISDSINLVFIQGNYVPDMPMSWIATRDHGVVFYEWGNMNGIQHEDFTDAGNNPILNARDYTYMFPCAKGGYIIQFLADNGLFEGDICFGGINDLTDNSNTDFSASLDGSKMILKINSLQPKNQSVTVYNITGQLLLKQKLNLSPDGIYYFNIPDWSQGIYIVQLQNETTSTAIKVLKQE